MAETGSEPQVLFKRRRGPGEKDRRDLKEAAQRHVVLAIYGYAGCTGSTIDEAKRQLAPTITETTWKRMLKQVPRADREAARTSGEAGEDPELDVSSDQLRVLIQLATRP
jgi:hypothetical protein